MSKHRVYILKSQHPHVIGPLRNVIVASGGSTRWDAQDRYISPAGVMVSESVIIYEFNGGADVVPKIHKLVERLKNLGEQEVLVETYRVEVWDEQG